MYVCVCVRARARRDSENGCLVGGMTEGVGCLGVTVAVAVQRSPSFALYIPLSLCLPPLAERARERESERAHQELTLYPLSHSPSLPQVPYARRSEWQDGTGVCVCVCDR